MTDDTLLVRDILDSIDAIFEFTTDGEAAFLRDRRTQFAVVRAFEIMGEAAKRISPAFRTAHPEIPWSMMARTRDKLIHDYPGVDPHTLWRAITSDLPMVRKSLVGIVGDAPLDVPSQGKDPSSLP